MKVNVLVLVLLLINKTRSLSNNTSSLELCRNATEVDYDSYADKKTRNCGCAARDTCIRKCCQKGFFYDHSENPVTEPNLSLCRKHDSDSFRVPVYEGEEKVGDEVDNFLVGVLDCDKLRYLRMNETDPRYTFYVQENGSLYYSNEITSNERYCLDEKNGLTIFLCSETDEENEMETLIHVAAKLISVPFLMTTGLVYALLPERNLHRIALMLHVFSLLLGNALFAVAQYTVVYDDTLCFCLGHSILFFMVASFFWMNVICIDIWLAFSGLRGVYVQEKIKHKIFFVASLYAWGLPALNVLIVFILNTYGDEEASYYPGIGVESCFLTEIPTIIYYFGPIFILILINFGFFILTAVNIQKVKKETKIIQDSQHTKRSKNEEDKFKLYWKLLFVMGLNPVVNTHIIQLISWSLGRKLEHSTVIYIWYFKDFAHATYGIIIFIIFVCQKKIWVSLKQRFHNICKSDADFKVSVTTSTNTSSKESDPSAIHLKGIRNMGADQP